MSSYKCSSCKKVYEKKCVDLKCKDFKGLDPKNIRSEHYHCINCNKGGSLFPYELIDFFSIPKGN